MSGYKIKSGCFVGKVKYLTQRPSGLYYFRMGIPESLRAFFDGKREHVHSLGTYIEAEAIIKAEKLAKDYKIQHQHLRESGDRDKAVQLLRKFELADTPLRLQPVYASQANPDYEEMGSPYWMLLQYLESKYELGGEQYSKQDPVDKRALDILHNRETVTLSEIETFTLRRLPKDIKKVHEVKRSFNYFKESLPTQYLRDIRVLDIETAIDRLIEDRKLKTTTMKKSLGIVRKATKDLIKSYELDQKNPFIDVSIKNLKKDSTPKYVFSLDELSELSEVISRKDNLLTAQIAGMLINTGCRCGEVGGILLSDLHLEEEVPYIQICPNSNRGLKTASSERLVPLVGLSLEVAKKIKYQAETDQIYAFERYHKNDRFADTSCSNAVNKFLRENGAKGTTHSFRHSLRDRLYESGASEIEINSICGWSSDNMVNYYGKSHALERMQQVLMTMLERENDLKSSLS